MSGVHLPQCTTCADVADPVRVVRVEGDDALCRDAEGRTHRVGVELVAGVAPGDVLLVHAGVAIARLDEEVAAP